MRPSPRPSVFLGSLAHVFAVHHQAPSAVLGAGVGVRGKKDLEPDFLGAVAFSVPVKVGFGCLHSLCSECSVVWDSQGIS